MSAPPAAYARTGSDTRGYNTKNAGGREMHRNKMRSKVEAHFTGTKMPRKNDIEAEVLSKKLLLITQNSGVGLVATGAASMILVATPSGAHASPFWWLWWLVLLAISAVRVAMSRQYQRAAANNNAAPHRWYRHYLILISVLSFVWVIGIAEYSWHASHDDRLLAALVAAAMAAGSISTLAPLITLHRIYASPMIAIVSIMAFASAEQTFDLLFGLIAMIYLYGISRSADYLHQTLDHSLRLAITERRQAEELQFANMVYQAIGEAVVICDTEGRIVATNNAFEKMSGFDGDQLITKTLPDLSSERQSEIVRQRMMHAVATLGYWQGEVFCRRSDGEEYVKWLRLTTVHDANGEPFRYVGMYSNMTDQKRAEEAAWREANYDALTLLPNRRLFGDRLEQEARKVQRTKQLIALLIVDLDGFNEVNDTLGHNVGDLLLIEAAKRIQSCIRLSDTVARTGGDEFSIILPNFPDTGHVERIAQTIIEHLRAPFKLADENIYVSASIGIAFLPNDASNPTELVKSADQAMFSSKRRGGNRYGFFTSSMLEHAMQRRRMLSDLRIALNQHQFRLLYQPIVSLADGNIIKAEALLRWEHPELGTIGPTDFIPLAEESGLIDAIGNWAFREAAMQVKRWRDEDGIELQVSVNRSAKQFYSNNNPDDWLEYLAQIGLPGDLITIEITESMILDSNPKVSSQLDRYRAAGIRISIDDFGTGYSSLSYLKKFKANFIKIDQSFVHDLEIDPRDLALSEAIIMMSHKLGFKVIAEGIETEEQKRILLAAGCDYGQGYLFARPLTAEDFKHLLQHRQNTRG